MTIRLRLTVWYTALLGVALVLFSVLVYSALSSNFWAQVEQDASRQANEVANALTKQLEGDILIIRFKPTQVQLPDLDLFSSASGIQVIGLDGLIYKRTSNLGELRVPDYASALDDVSAGYSHSYATHSEDSSLFVHSVPLIANGKVNGAVQVIKQVGAVENSLRQVARYLILGTALTLILAALVGAVLARRTLAPIDDITRTAISITHTGDLGRRLEIVESTSEVGELAATFNDMLDQIQSLFDTQQRLIADVSHELRTPLTTVQGNVEILQRMIHTANADAVELGYTVGEILGEVQDETARMGKMIGDLLLLAQADSGALQLNLEAVELDTLVLEVYRKAQLIAEQQKGLGAINIQLGDEDQALVMGDRERLRQLLLNLVENAVKYTPVGGDITIGLYNDDQHVNVYVADTGIGISEDNIRLIFDRFFRTDKARSREMGGSGLGLSIVRWIAEAHNGQITVTSVPNEGSRFTLRMPLLNEAKHISSIIVDKG